MPDLASFQRAFADALMFEGQPAPPFRSPAFAVYRNTSARAIVEALRATFPTVDMLLGAEMFNSVALDFRKIAPPRSPVLSDYGAGFPSFLAGQPWSAELPYLEDVARLDWLWLDCFLAGDEPAQPRLVADIPRLRLHRAARFAWFSTPALTIWHAHRTLDGFEEFAPVWREEGALFTRPGFQVLAEPIDSACYRLLLHSETPTTIQDCLADLGEGLPGQDVAALIRRCVALGALVII